MDAEDTQHPPPPTVSVSKNKHIARGKISSEDSTAIADKVIIKKKNRK
jgi:hypothetical protein